MRNTAEILLRYAKNNVIVANEIRAKNYNLYLLVLSNITTIKNELGQKHQVDLVIVPETLYDYTCYLKYYFGDCVNLSKLKQRHKSVYNYLSSFTIPIKEMLEEMGFKTEYDVKTTEVAIYNKLERMVASEGAVDISSLGRSLYQKIYYRARQQGLTVKEYIENMGFEVREIPTECLKTLVDSGMSYSQVASIFRMPKSTVYKRCKGAG